MFDEATSPNKAVNVEDIFAKAEPPPMPSQGGTVGSNPIMPPAPEWQPETSGSAKKWLIYIGIGVVLLVLIGGGWYAWSRFGNNEAPVTTHEPPVETTDTPVNVPTQVPPAIQGDIDGDGLTDSEEAELGTDPRRADSDEDGLFDKEEIRIYKSNPLQFDSDSDGYSDGQEVQNGYSPVGAGRLLELPTAE